MNNALSTTSLNHLSTLPDSSVPEAKGTSEMPLCEELKSSTLIKIGQFARKLHDKEYHQVQIRHDIESPRISVEKVIVVNKRNKEIYVVKTEGNDLHYGKERIASYLKVPDYDQEANAMLECLMWKLAKAMEVSEFFVPTKVVPLKYKEVGKATRAIMQPAVAGETMTALINYGHYYIPGLEIKELAFALLIAIAFGMFDAHSSNIMFSKNKKIRFIDNAQSLPHSNGFIVWNDCHSIRSSFRCFLLDLDNAREPLSDILVAELLDRVRVFKQHIDKLPQVISDFFRKSQEKGLMGRLPDFWFNEEAMLEAMRTRLDLAEKALSSDSPITLVELAVKANPRYPLAYGIELLANLGCLYHGPEKLKELALHYHGRISTKTTCERVNSLYRDRYDLSKIIALSEESPDFETFVARLVEYYVAFRNQCLPTAPKYLQAIEELRRGILLDMKEISSTELDFIHHEVTNVTMLRELGIPSVFLPAESVEIFDIPYPQFILSIVGAFDNFLVFRTKFGLIKREVKLARHGGMLGYFFKDRLYKMAISKENIEKLKNLPLDNLSIFPSRLPEKNDFDPFKVGNKIQITYEEELMTVYKMQSNGSVKSTRLNYNEEEKKLYLSGRRGVSLQGLLKWLEKHYDEDR